MAVFNSRDVSVTVNAVSLSDHVFKVDLPHTLNTSPSSAMGHDAETVTAGLFVPSLAISFRNDFAASQVYETMFTLFRARTAHAVVVIPVNAPVSPTNQSFTLTGIITDFPFVFDLGDTNDIVVTWANTAAAGLAVATS